MGRLRYPQIASLLYLGLIFGGVLLGCIASNPGLMALAAAGVGLVLMVLAVSVNMVVPAIVALLAGELLPKSLPALRLGNFVFGWGVGDMVVFLAFVILLGRATLSRKPLSLINGLSPVDRAMVGYHGTLLCAVIASLIRKPEDAIFVTASYAKMLEVLMIYALVRLGIRNKRSAHLILTGFGMAIAGAIAVSLLQLYAPQFYIHLFTTLATQSVALSEDFVQSVRWRLAGPFLNSNTLGMFTLLAIPFLSGSLVSGQVRNWVRFLDVLLIVLSIMVLFLTKSREAYLGFVVTLFYFLFVSARFRSMSATAKLVSVIVVACVYFLWPVVYHRVVEYTFGQGTTPLQSLIVAESTGARIDQWVAGLKALGVYGVTGAGLGQVAQTVGRFLPPDSPSFGGIHQTYMRALLEGGIVEFVGLLYLLWAIWKTAKSLPSAYKLAIQASLLGLAVTGLFGDTFQNIEIMVPFAYLLAALQGLPREEGVVSAPATSSVSSSEQAAGLNTV